ncbi:MAG: ClpXP protease specificity-enhancing factor [Pseudomonadota bacterium]
MTSRRPYLLRAMREWMLDNGLTPHIVVDARLGGVQVPDGFVRDGRIILNVSDSATEGLYLGNDRVEFSARFSGTPRQVSIPVAAVLGIYARETEQGMVFSAEPDLAGEGTGLPDDDPPDGTDPGSGERRGSHLKVVK